MYTPTNLQKELFAATSTVFIEATPGYITPNYEVASLLIKLTTNGYVVDNVKDFFNMSIDTFTTVEKQLFPILKSLSVDAYKLRDSFGSNTSLEDYSPSDWIAILASYAITYDWEDTFKAMFSANPGNFVLDPSEYAQAAGFPLPSNPKHITVVHNVNPLIADIMSSKIPLRVQQILLLQAAPLEALQQTVVYSIKSTEALVNNIIYSHGVMPNILSVDALMRFILANGQQGSTGKDYSAQILKPQLKAFRFHLPTRLKKFIWQWLEDHAVEGDKAVVEEMLNYEDWWKRCLHHAHWCSEDKFAKRYPNMVYVFYLFYGDHSWTFNSRYSRALQVRDYATAIEVASEKPGLLLRNLVMFCRYTEGAEIPIKGDSKPSTLFLNEDLILSSAEYWLKEEFTNFLAFKSPTIKLLWQAVEELTRPQYEEPIYERIVRGQTINYSTPIPAINVKLRDYVVNCIKQHIANLKYEANKSLGKVYLDPKLANLAIQYSGAESTSLSRSGNFLTPGSSVDIPADAEFIRLGVAWTADPNGDGADIDLSTAIISRNAPVEECYYGSPEWGNPLAVVSSGDITYSKPNIYSAEFIDIDIAKAKENGMESFLSSLHVYSGNPMPNYDTNLFMSFISADQRVLPRNEVTIDLAKQDYAIKLTENFTSFIGAYLNIDTMKCQFLCLGNKNDPQYKNIRDSYDDFAKFIANIPKRLTFLEIAKTSIDPSQLVSTVIEADTSIGVSEADSINVTKGTEQFNSIVF